MICRGNFLEILALILSFIICMVSFAMMMGSFVEKIEYRTITYSLFYIMPSILFSGAIWTRSSMDEFSLILSYIMPIGYVANDLRNFLVKGVAIDWQIHALILILFAILFFSLSIIGMKKTLRGKDDAADYPARIEIANS